MKFEVTVSPRFEMCYALAVRTALPAQEDEPAWLGQARRWGEPFWVALPDVLDGAAPEPTIAACLDAFAAVPAEQFAPRLSNGLFHDDAPAARREWLAYIGAEDRAAIRDRWQAGDIKADSLAVLAQFAAAEFTAQWNGIRAELDASAAKARRLAEACSLAELAHQLLLRVEVDEEKGLLKALRGGYALPLAEVDRLYLLPSVFNKRRLWHAADLGRPATVFLPYFDPAIPVGALRTPSADEFDPWLICRALGDPTRAAMVRRLAKGTTTAAELVAELGLSKANISHHVFQLREAGLIAEEREGRIVRLKLRGERLLMLSDQLRHALNIDERTEG